MSKSSRLRLPIDEMNGKGGIIVAMEIVLPEDGKVKAYTNGRKAGRVLNALKVKMGNLELEARN